MSVVVQAINHGARLAIREDGVLGDVALYLDDEGDETDVAEDAMIAVVSWRDGSFSPVDLSDFIGGARPH